MKKRLAEARDGGYRHLKTPPTPLPVQSNTNPPTAARSSFAVGLGLTIGLWHFLPTAKAQQPFPLRNP